MARPLINPSHPPRDHRSRRQAPGAAAATAPMSLLRWLAPAALAAALGATALAMPSPARAGDDLVRVLVDVADVIFRTGAPYYRDEHGRYERLVVVRGPYGPQYYRSLPPGYYADRRSGRHVKCNRHGKCKVQYTYYDPRHDRDRLDRYDRVRYRDRDWNRGRDWRDWYGRHDRHDDRDRVRFRVIRGHGDD